MLDTGSAGHFTCVVSSAPDNAEIELSLVPFEDEGNMVQSGYITNPNYIALVTLS